MTNTELRKGLMSTVSDWLQPRHPLLGGEGAVWRAPWGRRARWKSAQGTISAHFFTTRDIKD